MSDVMVYTGLPAAQAAHDSPPPDGPGAPQSLDAGRQAAPFARATDRDLRGPIDADAWKHADCGDHFWTIPGAAPLTCPRCEYLVSEEQARAIVQQDLCGQFLLAHYHDDPAGFLVKFDGWCHRTQAAVTRACAGFLGVECADIDRVWVESRERIAAHLT